MKLHKVFLAASLACLASAASAGTYDGIGGGQIPDNAPTNPLVVTFNVTEAGPLASLSLTMVGLRHSWAGDLIATLSAPNGTTVDLMRRPGSTTPNGVGDSTDFNGGQHRFIDGGADLAAALLALPPTGSLLFGDFAASGLFGAAVNLNTSFANAPLFGTWTLRLSDNALDDRGSLIGAALTVTAVPEPSTYLLFALGLAGVAALRCRRKA